MISLRIRVEGRVQGVYFRASTKSKAIALGIRGFVRNEFDGSVYIEAEGDEEAVNSFLKWCYKGPDSAIVTKLIQDKQPVQNFSNFIIA